MAFLDKADFCSLDDYLLHREHRVSESDLQVNGLYMYMMRFPAAFEKGAMQPMRAEAVQRRAGIAVVRFALLNNDLTTDITVQENMMNGLIEPRTGADFIDERKDKVYPIEEAYLRDYFEYQFGPLLSEQSKLSSSV
jgi:hypothetical protein